MSDNFYCPLPFKHAFIDSTGVAACCQTPRYKVSLNEWVSHPKLLELQQAILNNKVADVCQGCVKQEELQGQSLRTNSLRDYKDKRFTETDIDFIDFRSFNICNFKCRSCSPEFSHGIGQEVKKNPKLERYFGSAPESKTVSVDDGNVNWIKDNLHSLKRIMFTGGEPTRIPGVKLLIEQIKNNYPGVQVLITSNASFQDDFWYDLTRTFPNLHWTVSIDAIGDAASIIRHGSNWDTIEKNVRWLAKHSYSLDINTVVTNLNIFHLGKILEFGWEMQKQSATPLGKNGDLGCRHQFFVCTRPYYLSADNLSEDLLASANIYLQKLTTLDLDEEQSQMLDGLIQQISNASYNANLWEKQHDYNLQLDNMRNENHKILYEVQK